MDFSKNEKLAMVKMVDYIILADSKVAHDEMRLLTELMNRFNFDTFFIGLARNLKKSDALKTLSGMTLEKKKIFAKIFDEVAVCDGFVHEKEVTLIMEALSHMGINRQLQ